MIKFSNGHQFEYMTASGALGFDGRGWPWERVLGFFLPKFFAPTLFTNVIKTLTCLPRKGNLRMHNPLGCIRPIFRGGKIVGIVNAVGLTNPGIDWWVKNIGPKVDSSKLALVGSIFGTNEEILIMAEMLNRFDFVALEINVSCPNSGEKLSENTAQAIKACRLAKGASRFPIIVKLSVANDALRIAQAVDGIAEAISINSVPWNIVFPNKRSPLKHLGGGGVSGKIAQPFEWELVDRLNGVTDIPVIGPGVWNFEDIRIMRENLRVKAIGFGSVFVPKPLCPTGCVRRDIKARSLK